MADEREKPVTLSDRALEMVMFDVVDGLEEWFLERALSSAHAGFEVIDIQPAGDPSQPPGGSQTPAAHSGASGNSPVSGEIVSFPVKRRACG